MNKKADVDLEIQDNDTLLTATMLDKKIAELIDDAKLTHENNVFFKQAQQLQTISADFALILAINWREITKTFLFTAIRGLGELAEIISLEKNPSKEMITVLQTCFKVISDDLNNSHLAFNKAPKGHQGVHYKWWEDTILSKLLISMQDSELLDGRNLITNSTQKLLSGMKELGQNYLGPAIQLRVVEAIAYDIVVAYHAIFSLVEINNKKLFNQPGDLAWIEAHIEAEVVHHNQVSNEHDGMTYIAATIQEQEDFLEVTQWYIKLWADVFVEFNQIILNEKKYEHSL